MRANKYGYVRRFKRFRSADVPAVSEQVIAAQANSAELNADGLPAAPASELPDSHPLMVRYQESGVRITDLRSWKAAIQVGGTELAVA
jgi:hypothetical protein